MPDLPSVRLETSGIESPLCAVQIAHLVGIKYLYQLNVFVYCLFAFVGLTIIFTLVRRPGKWKRMTKEEREAQAYGAT